MKNKRAYYGEYGGAFVAEILMPALEQVRIGMEEIVPTDSFRKELNGLLKDYAGRETPLTFCPRLSKQLGIRLYLKREDLLHTGAHKINNTLGQALLARRLGKTRIIAETGAGQHGVATATAAVRLGLECIIFMGAIDVDRQAPNVQRMELLGARVVRVMNGTQTLKDAINEAMRFWVANQRDTFYCFGTAAGPYPFPQLVRGFQSVIGREARAQILKKEDRLPDAVVACVGGGSNAIGIFSGFIGDKDVKLIGVEAAGTGKPGSHHSAAINRGTPGILHGMKTLILQTKEGQIEPSHSIAAGLDYPAVGPEHVHLSHIGRVRYDMVDDSGAIEAFKTLTRVEGIIPALESSHAVAWVLEHHGELPKDAVVIVNLSGRGDKDMPQLQPLLNKKISKRRTKK